MCDVIGLLTVVAACSTLSVGFRLTILSWIPYVQKCRDYASKMLAFGFVLFLLSGISIAVASLRDNYADNVVFLILNLLLVIAVLLITLAGNFVPTIIAFRNNRSMFWYVFPINCMFMSGDIYWLFALVAATTPPDVWVKIDNRCLRWRKGKS